jgi:hypothetical protein
VSDRVKAVLHLNNLVGATNGPLEACRYHAERSQHRAEEGYAARGQEYSTEHTEDSAHPLQAPAGSERTV